MSNPSLRIELPGGRHAVIRNLRSRVLPYGHSGNDVQALDLHACTYSELRELAGEFLAVATLLSQTNAAK